MEKIKVKNIYKMLNFVVLLVASAFNLYRWKVGRIYFISQTICLFRMDKTV